MAERFYVTGLPRSRTAWLARLFCHGGAYCLHDPFRHTRSIEAIDSEFERIGMAANGISDSGLPLIRKNLRPGRWLIVRRDFDDAARSFVEMPKYPFEDAESVKSIGVMREIEAGLKEIERSETCHVVSFDDLDREDVVRGAWEFLLRDVEPWCDWHWREMRSIRIVTRPEVTEWRS